MASNWVDADAALLKGVYTLQCKSRMNAIYYERRLGQLQRHSFWMEIAIALAASGSGVASLLQNNKLWGPEIWQTLALVAAVVAIIRPIYAPGKKIETFTRQQQGYHANFFNLEKLAFGIRQEGHVTGEHRRRFDTFYDRYVQLSTEDEPAPHQRCLVYAQSRTEQELPPAHFWWPQDSGAKTDPADDEAFNVSTSQCSTRSTAASNQPLPPTRDTAKLLS